MIRYSKSVLNQAQVNQFSNPKAMKRAVMIVSVPVMMIALIGADMRRKDSTSTNDVQQKKQPCYGYTIIEFGKGIDCHGDTIKLMKVNGGQQRVISDQL
jgi:hypothetical protein